MELKTRISMIGDSALRKHYSEGHAVFEDSWDYAIHQAREDGHTDLVNYLELIEIAFETAIEIELSPIHVKKSV